jgi:hypothetical protein
VTCCWVHQSLLLSCNTSAAATSYVAALAAGLGKSDIITLWFDESKKIDSLRMGPDNGLAIVPAKSTWCRVPDSSGVFTVCSPSEGAKNSEALPEDQVQSLVADERMAEQEADDASDDDASG